ncbi:MAG: hypothetical protein WBD16_08980 [Pyrinomonadaceae bacterium]
MRNLSFVLLVVLMSPYWATVADAQSSGSLEISGRVSVAGAQVKLKRKRFYLFRGGLDANKEMVERIKAATVTSRDCFYCKAKASAEYTAWLKAQDCESPYCREIEGQDIAKVPEFQAAYQKGLKQFRNKPAIAQKWLTTNLTPALRDGFYLTRKTLVASLFGTTKPIQSSMTDSVSVVAIFIDIPLNIAAGKKTETFLVTNLVPVEIGGKSYVWACEAEIGAGKKAKLPALPIAETSKLVKKCEVIVRVLPKCENGSCGQ